MSGIVFALIILLIYSFGFLVTRLIYRNASLTENFGPSYLVGTGLITYLLFLVNILGIPFTKSTLILELIVINVLLMIVNIYFGSKLKSISKETLNLRIFIVNNKLKFVLLILLGILFMGSLLTNLFWPVKDWDALTLYDSRAKILVDKGFLEDLPLYYFSYPLLTSIAHAIAYVVGAQNPMILYSLFYGSFLLVFYGLCRKLVSSLFALFLTFLISISPQIFEHSMIAYTNLPYTIYFSLATLYLYYWITESNFSYLLVFTVLISLSTWTRSTEPYWLILLGLGLLFSGVNYLRKRGKEKQVVKIKKTVVPFVISLIGVYFFVWIWRAYSSTQIAKLAVNNPSQLTYFTILYEKIFDFVFVTSVLNYIIRFVIEPIWQLYLTYIVGLIYCLVQRKFLIYQFVLTTLICSMIAGIFLFAGGYSGWEEIHGSLLRMSMIFYPLLVFNIACIIGEQIK